MVELYDRVDRVAPMEMPVLIRGETGAGKELVARALNERSGRGEEALEALNCGAFPPHLVESLLFGHERGCFTGASERSTGLIVAAGTGTLFLDEVGELAPTAQAALLRVLSEGTVRPLGATEELPVRARIVAATHRDLEAMCDAGTFRRDLYFRLARVTLYVPPLRERVDELEPLVDRFIQSANEKYGMQVRSCSPEALAVLRRYGWPGNVRELHAVIEEAMVFCDDDQLGVDDLPARLVAPVVEDRSSALELRDGEDLRTRVRRYEADLIASTLDATGGNQKSAAEALQIPLRTLVHKIKSLGIRRRTTHGTPSRV